jgi:hypothetical protein
MVPFFHRLRSFGVFTQSDVLASTSLPSIFARLATERFDQPGQKSFSTLC